MDENKEVVNSDVKPEVEKPIRVESEELINIQIALSRYIEKHNGDVNIWCSVYAFDDNGEVVDDSTLIYGDKDLIKIDAEEHTQTSEEIIASGDEFVNNFYCDGDCAFCYRYYCEDSDDEDTVECLSNEVEEEPKEPVKITFGLANAEDI